MADTYDFKKMKDCYDSNDHAIYLVGCDEAGQPKQLFFRYPDDESVFIEFESVVLFSSIGKYINTFWIDVVQLDGDSFHFSIE